MNQLTVGPSGHLHLLAKSEPFDCTPLATFASLAIVNFGGGNLQVNYEFRTAPPNNRTLHPEMTLVLPRKEFVKVTVQNIEQNATVSVGIVSGAEKR